MVRWLFMHGPWFEAVGFCCGTSRELLKVVVDSSSSFAGFPSRCRPVPTLHAETVQHLPTTLCVQGGPNYRLIWKVCKVLLGLKLSSFTNDEWNVYMVTCVLNLFLCRYGIVGIPDWTGSHDWRLDGDWSGCHHQLDWPQCDKPIERVWEYFCVVAKI